MSTTAASAVLPGFKALLSNIRSLLNEIEQGVVTSIDGRDPNKVSASPAVRPTAELLNAYRKFAQASDELALYAADPSDHVTVLAGGFHESNALRVASELGVADVIAEKEVPLKEIALKVDADEVRLRQCMRALVNRRVFRETSFGSDVFANNRLSSILLSAHEKNLNGFIYHWCEETYRAGVSIVDAVRTSGGLKPPFDIYHGKSIWEYYTTPEGAIARQQANKAMIGAEPVVHGGLIYDYDWTKHGKDVEIVDVGGGIGGAAIELTRRFPQLKVILQDKPSVLDSAPKFWDEHAPECKSRVRFMPHDFFAPQPVSAKIYFLRFVLHDWRDDDCVRILRPLREAIPADGRVYVADGLLDENSERFKYMGSLQMMTLLGALERTEAQFAAVFARSGFELKAVHRNRGFTSLMELVPV